ncbi:hypothetical protein HF288_05705 [Acidithiobacillus caldus]|jgi:hypothetical protein|uniref:hypothetical protein n=1 Tax=Acidithiobacillus caldus TaxID=33059 RepID=UPI001C07BF35|nr:hypothetical protein [Acidithiobacillus caldus]MBU2790987.1 hypothetical protein [Acidithiobacillus caldus]MBU2820820.1 hypothetical protein [Acidithiobacillus caldus]
MKVDWLQSLKNFAERHPIVVLRFSDDEWDALLSSRRGVNEFTVARPHSLFDGLKVPAPCLIIGKSEIEARVCFGLLSSKSAVTTLESRVKVSRAVDINPSSEDGVCGLVTEAPHAGNLRSRLQAGYSVTLLSPKLSSHLIERLASVAENRGSMRAVAEFLSVPKRFRGNAALQQDAVQTALAAFGLAGNDQAMHVDLIEGKASALSRVPIMEDSVVEHDARSVPGYDLIQSDVTGRALFEKGDEQLEVFTANRRDLEHCLGVDLIYVNRTKQNIVMLQYKMLEPAGKVDDQVDWVYRPDAQLDTEIERMKAFSSAHTPGPKEYRLNPEIFYLKFVKRDASLAGGGIITPLDHFEKLRADPACKGPRKGLRVSYRTLNGSYMRRDPFLDLVKCGYIGAHAATTAHLRVLIDAILDGNKAVVAAIQQTKGT